MQHLHSEIVSIVDRDNNITGEAPRLEMSQKKLIHRSTYILLIDKHTKKLYVQKRASMKSYCPGHWDVFFGGVVQKDESYEENARRELLEETGLDSQQPIFLFDFYFESERTKSWGRVFYVDYVGQFEDLIHQADESEFIQLMSLTEINNRITNNEQFTPDGLIAFNKILNDGIHSNIMR